MLFLSISASPAWLVPPALMWMHVGYSTQRYRLNPLARTVHSGLEGVGNWDSRRVSPS
ncbi:hypothetical protein JOD64_000633 [Micromonospora luteifusca]|uniref:Uncharacterized protein n=1 Tax=Micromonospora luteifusca TaxID=709860 RepID=A0ABS2LML4_9ACTN|nr:hypothetical protein [Micromonospora luteifusca]